jgi:membrane fusion protein, multidrug efflux system
LEEFLMKSNLAFRRLAGALRVFALIGLAACEQQESVPHKPPAMVRAEMVTPSDHALTVRLTGEVHAQVQSDLAFRVGGRITERNVDVGDHVTANQVLARIDPEEQQADVTGAEAAVSAAEALLRQASAAFKRQKTLLSQGYTTQRDYDQAEEVFRTAKGSLESSGAQLAAARDQLSHTVLRAGVSGVITARNAEAGQVVQGAQAVFSLAHDGPRDAVFNVNESIFTQEPADGRIEISLLSNPEVKTTGTVREVAPMVDPTTGTVRVKVDIDHPPPAMTLGAAVSGEGRFKPRKVVVLPWSALSSRAGGPVVWVVDPRTRAVSPRPITVDRYENGKVIVRAGLQPGETVVVAGAQFLRPNQIVALAAGVPQ